jgi:hypothetical protein
MASLNRTQFNSLKAAEGNPLTIKATLEELEDRLFLELEPLGAGFVPIDDHYEIAEQLLLNENIAHGRAESIQQQESELTDEEIRIFVSLATEQRAFGFTEIWVEELSCGSDLLFLAVLTHYDSLDHLDNIFGVYDKLELITQDVKRLGKLVTL